MDRQTLFAKVKNKVRTHPPRPRKRLRREQVIADIQARAFALSPKPADKFQPLKQLLQNPEK